MTNTKDEIEPAKPLNPEQVAALEAELRDAIAGHMQSCRGWSVSSLAAHLAKSIIRAVPTWGQQYETYAAIQAKQAHIQEQVEALRLLLNIPPKSDGA
ncbi:hypothetical protein ACYOEI_00310 [Singulisphaera rosea]